MATRLTLQGQDSNSVIEEIVGKAKVRCIFLKQDESGRYICSSSIRSEHLRNVSAATVENYCTAKYNECYDYRGR